MNNIYKLRKKSAFELDEYYRNKRKNDFGKNRKMTGINLRKKIHYIPYLIIKLDRKLKKETITVIENNSTKVNNPVIYAATHIGGNEAERIFEAIKEHAYVMLGDPGIIYTNEIGLLLNMNGVLYIDTRNKIDRHIAYMRALELLKRKGNLLIFPEGAYNVFENLPIMKTFNCAVKLAQEIGCDIIPIGIEQYDNNFSICIGENMKVLKEDSIKEANQKLRDTLATLKWKIFEYQESIKRENIIKEELMNFRQSIVDRDDRGDYVYTLQDVYETMYHDKNTISEEKVFEILDDVEMNKNNANVLKRTKNKLF